MNSDQWNYNKRSNICVNQSLIRRRELLKEIIVKIFSYLAKTSLQSQDAESESCSVVSDSLQPHGLYRLWNSLGQNTRVCILSHLQGIFPTHGSNPGLLHFRQILYHLSHQGSFFIFSLDLSQLSFQKASVITTI